jgi:DNA-binding SARP family transcriptional activator/tetratricopeptide (TPR) repeat protein
MIELRSLGLLDLRDSSGNEIRSVLQQPKRLGLLSFLALASPRRYHRRDSLLALFWPELDQEHARAALRRSLYYLRTALGADVIIGRGEEELGVARDGLWCDAVAFDEALGSSDLARALELYRGELLEGFHVSGAPGFQDWLDRERRRLRDAAARAAWTLADAAERTGNDEEAGRWGRRGFELTSEDEDVLGRLLHLLDRTGDRSGALRIYEDFARRLTLEYDLEPSVDTRAVVEAIRTRPAVQRLIQSAGQESAVPTVTDPRVLAVFPFSFSGQDRLSYLAEGMVHLLSTILDGAADFRVVDPRALLAALKGQSSTELDLAKARKLAAELGAGLVLLGTVVEAGGRLKLSATVYGTSGETRARVQSQSSTESQLFDLVDQLARELLGTVSTGPAMRSARLAVRLTDSIDALKAYLEGEHCLRLGRYFDAMEKLQRALQADPAFALAHYHLAAAAAGCALPEFAREIIEKGYVHRHRLAEHDRLLLDAQRSWLQGDVSNAESLYNAITASYPDDVEAWFHLGDMLFHCNPMRGRSAAESRGAFERALWYEPDHIASLVHLMRIAAIEGRSEQALDLCRRVRALSPEGDQSLAHEAFVAFSTRDEAAIRKVIDALRHARAVTVAVAFSDVALYSGNAAGAERIARSFLEVARSPELRAFCHISLAHLAVAHGRCRAAQGELREAQALDLTQGLEARALVAALPFLPVEPHELSEIREQLRSWDPAEAVRSSLPALAVHNALHPTIKDYLAGLLAVRAGDAAEAHEALNRLTAASDIREAAPRTSLRKGLAATLARAEKGPTEALLVLGRPTMDLWFQATVVSPFLSLAHDRFLRAELLVETSRDAEALGWYGSLAERSPFELVFAAPAQLRRAEIFSRQGDWLAERAAYAQVQARWAAADAELQLLARRTEPEPSTS